MIIKQTEWYTVEQCRANPQTIYVFGDNLVKRGKGGQAIIRDEPNAFGIPTKVWPGNAPEDFLTDALWDNPKVRYLIVRSIMRLDFIVRSGLFVVLPADGLGTGRAQLPTRAPGIYKYINNWLDSFTETN